MTKLTTYSISGNKGAGVDMPKAWQEKENKILLAQAIRVYENRKHPGLSKTKTRGEVTASTRKIYKQKGTGRARHGALSAPIFVGGGVTHGPRGVKRRLSLPKKMRRKALNIALTLKEKEGKLLVVNGFSKLVKTKKAASLIAKIVAKEKKINKNSRFTFVLSEKNKDASLALRNIANVQVLPLRNLNVYSVYFGGVLIIDKEAIKEGRARSTGSHQRTGTAGQASRQVVQVERKQARVSEVSKAQKMQEKKTKNKLVKSVKKSV
jgi:large subunit ribosomal protein L4